MSAEGKLYERVKKNLVFLCLSITGFILFLMSVLFLVVIKNQLSENSRVSFSNNVNTILYYIRSQSVIDHTWISQMETNNHLILHIELNGEPLFYQRVAQTKEKKDLIAVTKQITKETYGLDISNSISTKIKEKKELFQMTEKGERYYAAALTIPLEEGYAGIIIIQQRSWEEEEFRSLRTTLLFLFFVSLFFLFLFAWKFTDYTLNPIKKSHRKQTEFIHAASHELRTPLSVIRTSISVIEDCDIEHQKRFLNIVESECERMSHLIEDMLTLASADNGIWNIKAEEVEIESLLFEVYESFENQAIQKGIHFFIQLPEEALPICYCDRERVKQVLFILLDNGIQYTPEGKQLRIYAKKEKKGAALIVEDQGIGIKEENKEKIFERFYREDIAREQRGHFGLGLSIAKEIIEKQKGSIIVKDTKGGGSTFIIRLPFCNK